MTEETTIKNILEKTPEQFRPNVSRAYEFAKEQYKGKIRYNGATRMSHALNVALLAASNDLDTNTVIASILHEVPIQQGEMIVKNTSREVLEIVKGAYSIKQATQSTDTDPQLVVKYILASSKDLRPLFIKIYDKLDDVRSIDNIPDKFIKDTLNKSLNVYSPLAEYLFLDATKKEIEEKAFQVYLPQEYQSITKKMQELGINIHLLNRCRGRIATSISPIFDQVSLEGRIKGTYSIYNKLKKYEKEWISPNISSLDDLIAFRIVTNNTDQCSLDSGKTLIDCNSKPDECKSVSDANSRDGNCIFISISVDDATGKIYQVIGTTKKETDYYARFDAATGTAVIVPTGKANVDKCEGGEGNNITSSILCNCGSVWTSALTGTCDQVCRVESLVCDRCNPPVSEPPVIVPSNPSNPYCGDGILGNTSGEQCEKGDPSGVKCSWNTCSNTTCKCPTVTAPYCGDGVLNVAGEQCEVGDPSGAIYKWADCNHTNCKGVVSGCGDGKLDAGEKCEKGDPTGYTCKWDECNQLKCQCVEPECGDGKLDTGEKCEKGNPTGSTCLWDECNKSSCTCEVKEVESCGDGKLQDNEQCEEGNPSGASCTWDKCSKSTCLCPIAPVESYPQTSIFESSYMRNIIIGGTLLILGILLYPMAQFIDDMYITIGGKAIKIGRYVTKHDEVSRNKKKKKIEDNFK